MFSFNLIKTYKNKQIQRELDKLLADLNALYKFNTRLMLDAIELDEDYAQLTFLESLEYTDIMDSIRQSSNEIKYLDKNKYSTVFNLINKNILDNCIYTMIRSLYIPLSNLEHHNSILNIAINGANGIKSIKAKHK